jgi:hypothetical protein
MRARAYSALRSLGVSRAFLFDRAAFTKGRGWELKHARGPGPALIRPVSVWFCRGIVWFCPVCLSGRVCRACPVRLVCRVRLGCRVRLVCRARLVCRVCQVKFPIRNKVIDPALYLTLTLTPRMRKRRYLERGC